MDVASTTIRSYFWLKMEAPLEDSLMELEDYFSVGGCALMGTTAYTTPRLFTFI